MYHLVLERLQTSIYKHHSIWQHGISLLHMSNTKRLFGSEVTMKINTVFYYLLLVRMFDKKKDAHKWNKLNNKMASSIGLIVLRVSGVCVWFHVLPFDGPALHRTVACAWCPGCIDSCWPPGYGPADAFARQTGCRNKCGFCRHLKQEEVVR